MTGIWADDSDNEVDTRPSFKSAKTPKSYSTPIGFVAGGIQQAGKTDKKNNEEDKSDEDESETPSASFKIDNSSSDSESESKPSRTGKRNNIFSVLLNFFLKITS